MAPLGPIDAGFPLPGCRPSPIPPFRWDIHTPQYHSHPPPSSPEFTKCASQENVQAGAGAVTGQSWRCCQPDRRQERLGTHLANEPLLLSPRRVPTIHVSCRSFLGKEGKSGPGPEQVESAPRIRVRGEEGIHSFAALPPPSTTPFFNHPSPSFPPGLDLPFFSSFSPTHPTSRCRFPGLERASFFPLQ